VPGRTVIDGHRRQHQPRTQRFCRTMDRFGVAYGIPVGKNYIDQQPR
jgi:hypothetical protein